MTGRTIANIKFDSEKQFKLLMYHIVASCCTLLTLVSNGFTVSHVASFSIKFPKVIHFINFTHHIEFNLLKVIQYMF
jgi:hypothetical protein